MNILHVYKRSLPASFGGVETFIDSLCSEGAEFQWKSDVLAMHPRDYGEKILYNGYGVHTVKETVNLASTSFSIEFIRKFIELSADADVIHYHFPYPFADCLQLFCRIRKPYVITYHSDVMRQKFLNLLYRPLRNWFMRNADVIVVTSQNYFNTSYTLQPFHEKVRVIPIGLARNRLIDATPEKLAYWRSRFSKPFFLFVGELRYYKGLDVAIDAVRNTDLELVIVGAAGIEKRLKKQVKRNSVHNVSFVGHVDEADKAALLKLCYAFVFPSHLRSEAFGIALLEAAFRGNAMISCEIGTGTSFVNIHKKTGIVVEPSSPVALREAMEFLKRDPKLTAEFGKNAKARAEGLFEARSQAQKYNSIYEELVK